MNQPVVLVIDPKPDVLWAIQEDLQQNYHQELKVLYADSSLETLKQLEDLRWHNTTRTLLIVRQKSSHMESTDFLQLALEMFPDVKQLMLKVYDDENIPSRVPIPKAFVIRTHELKTVLPDAQLLTNRS